MFYFLAKGLGKRIGQKGLGKRIGQKDWAKGLGKSMV
jgi:hypothetical protein